ncbi:hypothetical protein STEG23_001684, partial [Scotinomys teguina]
MAREKCLKGWHGGIGSRDTMKEGKKNQVKADFKELQSLTQSETNPTLPQQTSGKKAVKFHYTAYQSSDDEPFLSITLFLML